ncbi:MAG: hypothetical protein ACYDCI_07720 [Candidatus Limnocylindrales bacterium]
MGRAIIIALGQDQEAAADVSDANADRAALDDAELRAVERVEYYGEAPSQPPVRRTTPLRRLIDRLFER